MKPSALLSSLALAVFTSLPALGAPPAALNVETIGERQLTPRSAFELRFTEPMVADDLVGKADVEAPITIEPALKGKWVWLSTQSGAYQLTEPPPLGTNFQLVLRSTVKNAAGKPLKGSLKEDFFTPPFRVKGW